jgi:heat shock protein HslJ
MIRTTILAAMLLAGCTTATPGMTPGVAGAYQLMSIDGRSVGRIGMRLTLEQGGTARFGYDCGERFANYRIAEGVITFSEISPSTGSCTDGERTGIEKALDEQRSRLLYGEHKVVRSMDRLTLSGSHTYVFTPAS